MKQPPPPLKCRPPPLLPRLGRPSATPLPGSSTTRPPPSPPPPPPTRICAGHLPPGRRRLSLPLSAGSTAATSLPGSDPSPGSSRCLTLAGCAATARPESASLLPRSGPLLASTVSSAPSPMAPPPKDPGPVSIGSSPHPGARAPRSASARLLRRRRRLSARPQHCVGSSPRCRTLTSRAHLLRSTPSPVCFRAPPPATAPPEEEEVDPQGMHFCEMCCGFND